MAVVKLPVILIKDGTVSSRRVGDNTFDSQTGVMVLGEDEAMGIEISLRRGRTPYPVGRYYLGGGSFDRDKYHRPCFSGTGLELIPVSEVGVPPAQAK